ncbi:MAG: hypothetical protein ACFUZC_05025 [Chthoniobacteraceae bacterium]
MSLETSPWNARYLELLSELCKPAPGALEWFLDLLDVAFLWDHLVDREATDEDVQRADRVLEAMLVRWPLNPFYHQHITTLVPTLAAAISAWRFSNQPGAPKLKAYDLYTEVPAVMGLIIHGPGKCDEILLAIRESAFHRMEEDETEDGGKK